MANGRRRTGKRVTTACDWHDWRLVYTSHDAHWMYCLCYTCGEQASLTREEYGSYLGIKAIREYYGLDNTITQAQGK